MNFKSKLYQRYIEQQENLVSPSFQFTSRFTADKMYVCCKHSHLVIIIYSIQLSPFENSLLYKVKYLLDPKELRMLNGCSEGHLWLVVDLLACVKLIICSNLRARRRENL